MMVYQASNSTFVPKQKSLDSPSDNTDKNIKTLPKQDTQLIEIRQYNTRIDELEKKLQMKEEEINDRNLIIISLEEKLDGLKNMDRETNNYEADNLGVELNSIRDENTRLKKELIAQNEQLHLLYIVMIILALI